MCNHYANDLRKLGRFLGGIIGEQFSDTKVPLRFDNQVKTQVYPDKPGVVLRQVGDGFELQAMRWGFPKNVDAEGNIEKGATWVTNARHVMKGGRLSTPWAEWTGPEYRCLVPATSFFEPDQRTVGTGGFREVEFARADGEPFFGRGPACAARRRSRSRATTNSTPSSPPAQTLVKPVRSKAMPVILGWDDAETWLNEPIEDRPAAGETTTAPFLGGVSSSNP
jgi:putative SOS response-associated peptidase YedK